MSGFECEICNEEYSNEDENHRPKALKCGHSLCQNCAAKLIEGLLILCPFCREETEIREGNAKNLPNNFGLIRAMETMKTSVRKEVVSNNLAPKSDNADLLRVDPSTQEDNRKLTELLLSIGPSGHGWAVYQALKNEFNSGKQSMSIVKNILIVCTMVMKFNEEYIPTLCIESPRFLEYAWNIGNDQNCFDEFSAWLTTSFSIMLISHMSGERKKAQLIQSKKYIDAWHKLSPQSPDLLLMRGIWFMEMHKVRSVWNSNEYTEQAVADLKESNRISPGNIQKVYMIADNLLLLGRKREAKQYFQQVIQMESQNQLLYDKALALLTGQLRNISLN